MSIAEVKDGEALFSFCFVAWAFAITYTNHAPLIPVLMTELGLRPEEAGLISTAFFLALGAVLIPAGAVADRFGLKRPMSVGLLVTLLGNLGMALAPGLGGLLAAKVVTGLGCGLTFVGGVRYSTLSVRGSIAFLAQGLYGGFVQFGAATALYLMPVLHARWGWRLAFVISSAPLLVALGIWLGIARDVRPAGVTTRRLVVWAPEIWRLGFVHTATFGVSMLVGTWVTTFLVHDLHLSLIVAGMLGSAVLLVGIVSRPVGGLALDSRWWRPEVSISASLLCNAAALGLLALPGRPLAVAMVVVVVLGVSLSLPYSAVMNTAAASRRSGPGAAVGLVNTIMTVLVAAGAPAIGAVYARAGTFSAPFALLALFCALVLAWQLGSMRLSRSTRGETA